MNHCAKKELVWAAWWWLNGLPLSCCHGSTLLDPWSRRSQPQVIFCWFLHQHKVKDRGQWKGKSADSSPPHNFVDYFNFSKANYSISLLLYALYISHCLHVCSPTRQWIKLKEFSNLIIINQVVSTCSASTSSWIKPQIISFNWKRIMVQDNRNVPTFSRACTCISKILKHM